MGNTGLNKVKWASLSQDLLEHEYANVHYRFKKGVSVGCSSQIYLDQVTF